MSYRLIDANALAMSCEKVNDMPCIYANLPYGLDGGSYILTLGLDYLTRWYELFGTPERAARTLANVCQFTHGGELCDRYQCYLFGDCDGMLRLRSEQSIYDALLEWLRGDA